MRPVGYSLLALTVLLAPSAFARQGGKLDRVREEVRDEKKPSEPSEPSKPDRHGVDGSRESVVGGVLGEEAAKVVVDVIVDVIVSPGWVPQEVLEDDGVRSGYFLPFPYADGNVGSMTVDPLRTCGPSVAAVKTVAARVLVVHFHGGQHTEIGSWQRRARHVSLNHTSMCRSGS